MITTLVQLKRLENECILKINKINTFKLKKGVLLFRSAVDISKYSEPKSNLNRCIDTGKKGIYLANNVLISLAIMIEENKLSEIGVFELNEDITIAIGKHSFRQLNPSRYFDISGTFIKGVHPLEEEHISHIECYLQPLKIKQSDPQLVKLGNEIISLGNSNPKKKIELQIEYNRRLFLLPPGTDVRDSCEIFISKDVLLNGDEISLVKKYKVNSKNLPTNVPNKDSPSDAERLLYFIEKNNYQTDIHFYIQNSILIQFSDE
tara:strand:+ start:2062 stop:2847 length:786 start_codon:yes stop_codon:yes gene_type:complete